MTWNRCSAPSTSKSRIVIASPITMSASTAGAPDHEGTSARLTDRALIAIDPTKMPSRTTPRRYRLSDTASPQVKRPSEGVTIAAGDIHVGRKGSCC